MNLGTCVECLDKYNDNDKRMTDRNPDYYQIEQAMMAVCDSTDTCWPFFGGTGQLALH